MHPAFSVIVFTTLSGFGYGLAALLGLAQPEPTLMVKAAFVVALISIAVGLLSSTLHLGNPQRAWRAFSQWRSSWLSREGVLAVLTFIPLTAQAYFVLLDGRFVPWLGIVGALFCAATVYGTSMIYASLKTVYGWHSQLTSACYLGFAAAGGAIGLALSSGAVSHIIFAELALVAAFALKFLWWKRLDTGTGPSSPESATGLGHLGQVRLLERPHMNENYLTREMGFRIARKHAAKLRAIALALGLVVPVVLLMLAASVGLQALIVLALVSHLAGVLTERWLFFAEAKHAVSLYYGASAA